MPRVGIHDSYNWPPRTYADIVAAEDEACTLLSDIISGFKTAFREGRLHRSSREFWLPFQSGELNTINTILCSDIMRESPPEGEGGN
jgi:hypothetical protein